MEHRRGATLNSSSAPQFCVFLAALLETVSNRKQTYLTPSNTCYYSRTRLTPCTKVKTELEALDSQASKEMIGAKPPLMHGAKNSQHLQGPSGMKWTNHSAMLPPALAGVVGLRLPLLPCCSLRTGCSLFHWMFQRHPKPFCCYLDSSPYLRFRIRSNHYNILR